MKCDRAGFLRALRLAQHGVDAKSNLPTLNDVVLSAKRGVGCIESTDLKRTMRVQLPCTGELEPTPVNAKNFAALLNAPKKKRGEKVIFSIAEESNGKRLQIVIGKRTFLAELGGKLEDRPKSEGFATKKREKSTRVSLDGGEFSAALSYIAPAICKDETRYHLNHALWQGDRLVSTDGHRLHLHALESPSSEAVLLSKGTVYALIDSLRQVKPDVVWAKFHQRAEPRHTGLLVVHVENGVLNVELRERTHREQFPEVDQVVPKRFEEELFLGAASLLDAAESAKVTIDTTLKGVQLTAKAKKKKLSVATDSFAEVLKLEKSPSADLLHRVNACYLIDALHGYTDEDQVCLGLNVSRSQRRARPNLAPLR
jgi:DNA polymerase III sliding clamp (beta) subunit (PCNA family)